MGLRAVSYSAGEKIKLCRLLSFSDHGVSVWGQFNYEYFIIIINYLPMVGHHGQRNDTPFCREPKLLKVLTLKPAVNQNLAMCAMPTAKNISHSGILWMQKLRSSLLRT